MVSFLPFFRFRRAFSKAFLPYVWSKESKNKRKYQSGCEGNTRSICTYVFMYLYKYAFIYYMSLCTHVYVNMMCVWVYFGIWLWSQLLQGKVVVNLIHSELVRSFRFWRRYWCNPWSWVTSPLATMSNSFFLSNFSVSLWLFLSADSVLFGNKKNTLWFAFMFS